jgi:hypothetical protein
MSLDQTIQLILTGLWIASNWFFFIWLRRLDTRKVNEERIRLLEEKADSRHHLMLADINQLERRLSDRLEKTERDFIATVGPADMAEIFQRLNRIGEEISGVKGEMDEVKSNLRLLMNRIVEKGLK